MEVHAEKVGDFCPFPADRPHGLPGDGSDTVLISMRHVSKTYPNGTHALYDVSFQVQKGEFVFVVGSSGAGKSTLLKLITCEEKPDGGELSVNGEDLVAIKRREVPYLRRTLGMVFQDFRLIPTMNVFENVAFAMRIVGASRREIRKRVPYMLGLVDLLDKQKSYPAELSGGEQQRVAIARALAHSPQVIFADEPTGELDTVTGLQVVKIFKDLTEQEGVTIVMTTHDTSLMEVGDAVYELEDGEVIHGSV